MSEISNKTLVGLLVVAIVISLAGTFISLNKLGQLQSITGMQANVTSDTGTTSAEILGTAQITLYNKNMDFGDGQVNGSLNTGNDFCQLFSNGTITAGSNDFSGSGLSIAHYPACIGWGAQPASWVIENTGNTNFNNLTMYADGGVSLFTSTFPSNAQTSHFKWRLAEEDGANACGGTAGHTTSFTNMTTSPVSICDDFQYASSSIDSVLVQISLGLSEDVPAADWSDNVTFTGNT